MSDLQAVVMPDDAHALRPVRFMPDDQLREYTAVTFPRNPKGGCGMYYRRCKTFGGVTNHGSNDEAGLCDVLNEDGDIVENFSLNKKGLNYLYKALGLRVEA